MPKYLVYVPFSYYSVYMIEADSPEAAKEKYNTGTINYDEDYLYDTDMSDTGGELEVEEANDE